jgi:hypothetical protein
MKVFIWSYVSELTDNYHSSGGLVVFANDIERAMELAIAQGVEFSADEVPDDVRVVDGGAEAVWIMPNAGCC